MTTASKLTAKLPKNSPRFEWLTNNKNTVREVSCTWGVSRVVAADIRSMIAAGADECQIDAYAQASRMLSVQVGA